MSSDGVCIDPSQDMNTRKRPNFKRGGLTNRQTVSKYIPQNNSVGNIIRTDAECVENCLDQSDQQSDCLSGMGGGPGCSCQWMGGNFNWQSMLGGDYEGMNDMSDFGGWLHCTWHGGSSHDCFNDCYGGGRPVSGRTAAGRSAGSGRRTGGPISPKARMKRRRRR